MNKFSFVGQHHTCRKFLYSCTWIGIPKFYSRAIKFSCTAVSVYLDTYSEVLNLVPEGIPEGTM